MCGVCVCVCGACVGVRMSVSALVLTSSVTNINWGEHERAPHRRAKHEKICMYLCMYVCKFDTNFTYSDGDPLR